MASVSRRAKYLQISAFVVCMALAISSQVPALAAATPTATATRTFTVAAASMTPTRTATKPASTPTPTATKLASTPTPTATKAASVPTPTATKTASLSTPTRTATSAPGMTATATPSVQATETESPIEAITELPTQVPTPEATPTLGPEESPTPTETLAPGMPTRTPFVVPTRISVSFLRFFAPQAVPARPAGGTPPASGLGAAVNSTPGATSVAGGPINATPQRNPSVLGLVPNLLPSGEPTFVAMIENGNQPLDVVIDGSNNVATDSTNEAGSVDSAYFAKRLAMMSILGSGLMLLAAGVLVTAAIGVFIRGHLRR